MPLEICDSEDDGSFDTEGPSIELPAPPLPIPTPQKLTNETSSLLLTDSYVPTSGEIRRIEIEAAHAALIAPSPLNQTSVPQLTMTPSVSKQPERDIYDLSSDEDLPIPKPKTQKRAVTMPSTSREIVYSDSDFEPSKSKKVKQKKAKTPAVTNNRAKTDPIPVFDLSSGTDDDWGTSLSAKSKPRVGTKASKNKSEEEALPKSRARREAVKDINYHIPPPLGSPTDEESNGDTTNKIGLTSPTKNFMVDLTKEDLLLATQKRQEYDTISLTYPTVAAEDGLTPTFPSTIPDPPDQGPISIEPPPPELTSAEFIAPSFPEVGDPDPPKKKRAKTDLGLGHGLTHNLGVASEWRAAKGKGRTNLSDTKRQVHSDEDFGDVFEVHSDNPPRKAKKLKKPKEKKPVAKKKSKKASTVDEANTVVEDIVEVDQSSIGDTIAIQPDPSPEKEMSNGLEGELSTSTTPSLRITLKVKTGGEKNTRPPNLNIEPSPERKGKRTKSRFVEPTCGSEDELSVKPQELSSRPSPNMQDNIGRKKTTLIMDSGEEFGDLTPPPPSPPPKMKEPMKRKRTKSALKNETTKVENVPTEVEPPKKKRGRKPNQKAPEKQETPVIPLVTEKSMSPPAPVTPAPESKPEKDRSISTTPAPQSEDAAKKRAAHSPIRRDSKVPYRVGLSKRVKVESLLKIVRK